LIKKELMSGRKELTLFMGIRWQKALSEEIAENSEALLERLTQLNLERKIPLHWNFPNIPYLEKKSPAMDLIITEIKTRIASCKDVVIPMGFSGAPHPLLGLPELENELEFSLSNSGKNGIVQQFKENTGIIIPFIPDIMRKEALKLYGKKGFRLLGLPFQTTIGDFYRFGPCLLKKPVHLFFYQQITALKRERKNLLPWKLATGVSHLFLLLDFSNSQAPIFIEDLIRDLEKKYHLECGSLKEEYITAQKVDFDLGSYIPPLLCNPRARVYYKGASLLAVKNPKSETQKFNILKLISCNNLDLDRKKMRLLNSSPQKPFLSSKAISAHMPGEVTLPGADFDVKFSGGKLHSLLKGGKNYFTGRLPRSALKAGKKIYDYTAVSIFSFEDEKSRGLQEKLLLSVPGLTQESTIIREYYYVEEFPFLIVTMETTYPDLSTIPQLTQITPFEFPLLKFKKQEIPSLYSLYRDNTQANFSLNNFSTIYNIAGSAFCLKILDSYLIFGFIPHKNPEVQSIQFRMEQDKHEYLLYANLYGTYNPEEVTLYGNTREVCSLFIGIKDQLPPKLPFFPQSALKTLPGSRIASYA
jgi:hypothetical protein